MIQEEIELDQKEFEEGYKLYERNKEYALTYLWDLSESSRQGVLSCIRAEGKLSCVEDVDKEDEELERSSVTTSISGHNLLPLSLNQYVSYKRNGNEYAELSRQLRELKEKKQYLNKYMREADEQEAYKAFDKIARLKKSALTKKESMKLLKLQGLMNTTTYNAFKQGYYDINTEISNINQQVFGISTEGIDDRVNQVKEIDRNIKELELKQNELLVSPFDETSIPAVEFLEIIDKRRRLRNLRELLLS